MSLLDKFLKTPKNKGSETVRYSDKISLFNKQDNTSGPSKISTANINKAAKQETKK